MRQLANKLVPQAKVETGTIKLVNYATHRVDVTVKGYGVIKDIMVQSGIQLGTSDRVVVQTGDLAEIRWRPRDNRWICTAIHVKVHCPTATAGISPDVEVENSLDTADSYIDQQLSSLETPFDLRLPPYELLGQLTLPDFRNINVNPYDIGDGVNSAISGTTEMLYFVTSRAWVIRDVNLYTLATDIELVVEMDGLLSIDAVRVAGTWTINGEAAGSADLTTYTLLTPVAVFGQGVIFRTYIVGAADSFAYGLGGNI